MKGFQHFSQPLIQSINSESVLEICTSVCVDKNRHKWWNRGELPRINETEAKVQGKTHDNCSNSQFLSVHSSKSLAEMLAGSFQHCLWWLHSTRLQELSVRVTPEGTPTGMGSARAAPSCCSDEVPGWAFPQRSPPSAVLQTQGSAARCTARGIECLRWAQMTLPRADFQPFDPVCSSAGFPLLTAAAQGVEVWFLLRLMALLAALSTLNRLDPS